MALVLSDEVTREAQRILASANSFDVLGILPQDCTPELVQQRHSEKVQLFRRHFRNKTAMLAKARVDEAKVKLLEDRLRDKEREIFLSRVKEEARLREEMVQLEQRTRLLELRAEVVASRKRRPRPAPEEEHEHGKAPASASASCSDVSPSPPAKN